MRVRTPAPRLGTAAAWFPLVGGAVGALAGCVAYVTAPTLGPPVAGALAAAALAGITGALHLDGLADCADGLGVRGDRSRRLTVMRDPSIGAFGALALLLWLVLVVEALAGLDRGEALRALVVAAATGRWAALLHARLALPARPDGLGASFAVAPSALAIATVSAGAGAGLLLGVRNGAAALAAGFVAALMVTAWSRVALGGRTGDTLGASVTLAEVAVLLTLLGLLAPAR